jgi:4-amino-4-deoxy-L-arabinose transferase-like glycosyltransferase
LWTNRRAWIVGVLLLGVALRITMLSQDVRFHPDEALYATFARRISAGDWLLSDAPLDKPPLALALTGLSFTLFGTSEFAARLPSLAASLLSIATLYGLAKRCYGSRVALLAALLLALCPLDLAFAATNFMDPVLTFWLLLAFLAVAHDRWNIAGVASAAALATKQNALGAFPIIVLFGLCANAVPGWRWRRYAARIIRLMLPILVGCLLLALWSTARAAPIDFWMLGAINNDPGRLIRANEVIPRLVRWLTLLGNVTGFAPLLLLAFIPAAIPLFSHSRKRGELLDTVLFIGLCGTLLGYWLIAFNTYDRYLLPLAPLLLILVARGALYSELRLGRGMPILVVLLMLPFTTAALRGQLDVGGDHGLHTGIDQLAATLNALPAGVRIYDFSLDWELGYYLGSTSTVRLIFQPSPAALARAVCNDSTPAYFATVASEVPAWLDPGIQVSSEADNLLNSPFRLYQLRCAS